VRVVAARLAAKVPPAIVVVLIVLTLGSEAFQRCACLEQRAVDAEVFAAHQILPLITHCHEECRGDLVGHQAVAIPRVGAGIN
jgi:hypothetical protein